MAKRQRVERPVRRSEYEIVFATSQAAKGWRDLLATTRGPLVEAWDFLTRTPRETSSTCHQLKGDLATITREGVDHERWQYELPGGARLWFYVTGEGKGAGTVNLLEVHTHHPNATK